MKKKAPSIVLDERNIQILNAVFLSNKHKAITKFVLEKTESHFNEICGEVCGSRTKVNEALSELTLANVLVNQPQVIEVNGKKRWAVVYRINPEVETLVKKLAPLL